MKVDLKKVKKIAIVACDIGMGICLLKATIADITKDISSKQENK